MNKTSYIKLIKAVMPKHLTLFPDIGKKEIQLVVNLMKKQILILVGVAVFVIGFFFLTRNTNSNSGTLFDVEPEALEMSTIGYKNKIETDGIYTKESESGLHRTVFVDVQGEVVSPGVFEVDHDVRVGYLIDLADGLTDYSCIRGLNRAARIYDEMVIFIPHIDNVSADDMGTNVNEMDASTVNDSNLISISSASALELQSLPGIGTVLSENIITHRTENGEFSSIDELINVNGIGAGIMENIRELIKP